MEVVLDGVRVAQIEEEQEEMGDGERDREKVDM